MASLTVMVVNGTRYLLNEDASCIDQSAKIILDTYPHDAKVHFESPKHEDLFPHKYIQQQWKN